MPFDYMFWGPPYSYNQAEQALASDEVPVGCVFVNHRRVIGQGMNDTNRSMNVRIVYPEQWSSSGGFY